MSCAGHPTSRTHARQTDALVETICAESEIECSASSAQTSCFTSRLSDCDESKMLRRADDVKVGNRPRASSWRQVHTPLWRGTPSANLRIVQGRKRLIQRQFEWVSPLGAQRHIQTSLRLKPEQARVPICCVIRTLPFPCDLLPQKEFRHVDYVSPAASSTVEPVATCLSCATSFAHRVASRARSH